MGVIIVREEEVRVTYTAIFGRFFCFSCLAIEVLASSRICVANFGKIGIQICTIFGIREMSTGKTLRNISQTLFVRSSLCNQPSPFTAYQKTCLEFFYVFETLLHFIRPHAVLVPTPPFLVYFVNPDMALSHSQKHCTEMTQCLFVPLRDITQEYMSTEINRPPTPSLDFAGCGCHDTEHKCCPDNFTPAEGPNYEGCPCHTHEFGCCADGESVARGPGQVGRGRDKPVINWGAFPDWI